MKLTVQKTLAAQVLKCSEKRVCFDPARLIDIKEAITKRDIKALVGEGAIAEKQKTGISRVRTRHNLSQKRKGLRKGPGKRKGKANARHPDKEEWIRRIRHQRGFLQELKTKKIIRPRVFVLLYQKAKGGFFRSKRHIKIYIEENQLADKSAVSTPVVKQVADKSGNKSGNTPKSPVAAKDKGQIVGKDTDKTGNKKGTGAGKTKKTKSSEKASVTSVGKKKSNDDKK